MSSSKHPIEIVELAPLPEGSAYMKPFRLHYKQNGKLLNWDCIKTHNSVAILIYNSTRNVLVFVRQFRPAVLLSSLFNSMDSDPSNIKEKFEENAATINPSLGFTLELCAGIMDKEGLSPAEIAREEVIEETGYSPPLDALHLITTCRSGVGSSGSLQYIFFCEVTDSMRVSDGGGIDDESIEVVEFSVEESRKQIYQCDLTTGVGRTPGFRLAISWFIHEKYPSLQNKSS